MSCFTKDDVLVLKIRFIEDSVDLISGEDKCLGAILVKNKSNTATIKEPFTRLSEKEELLKVIEGEKDVNSIINFQVIINVFSEFIGSSVLTSDIYLKMFEKGIDTASDILVDNIELDFIKEITLMSMRRVILDELSKKSA